MKKNQKITIAICYDFDGTLIRGNMQENSFIPDLGMNKAEFWEMVTKEAKENDMDEVLAYMHLMMRESTTRNKPFSQAALKRHGKNVNLFPGVMEWFEKIDAYGNKIGLKIDHYIISSGIDEMIKGSPIGKKFKHVFASGFIYDANKTPIFSARSVNYTTKTQYLFRINKGIINSWNNSVNSFMEESERPNPFSRMIYLGDGETDVPAMKTLNFQGGYSIAVYPPKSGKRTSKEEMIKQKTAEKLHSDNRAQFVAEADYTENKRLYKIVTAILDRISDEECYQMNRKA